MNSMFVCDMLEDKLKHTLLCYTVTLLMTHQPSNILCHINKWITKDMRID